MINHGQEVEVEDLEMFSPEEMDRVGGRLTVLKSPGEDEIKPETVKALQALE